MIRSLLSAFFLLVSMPHLPGAVIYSGLQDIPVPNDPAGLWFNIATGATSSTEPGSWNTAPWLNLFFGGTAIGNDDLLLPVITGLDQVVNLTMGTLIDSSQTYPAAESGSSTHVGTGAGQFPQGAEGLLGCKFQLTTGGPIKYGWVRVVIQNTGPGAIRDWAYEGDDAVGIQAGFTGTALVPEPARAMLLASGFLVLLVRRQRVLAR